MMNFHCLSLPAIILVASFSDIVERFGVIIDKKSYHNYFNMIFTFSSVVLYVISVLACFHSSVNHAGVSKKLFDV